MRISREEKNRKKREGYYKNREKCKASHAKYYQSHKEKCNLLTKKWRDNNPDKVKAIHQRYYKKWGKYYNNTPKALARRKEWAEKRRCDRQLNVCHTWANFSEEDKKRYREMFASQIREMKNETK